MSKFADEINNKLIGLKGKEISSMCVDDEGMDNYVFIKFSDESVIRINYDSIYTVKTCLCEEID